MRTIQTFLSCALFIATAAGAQAAGGYGTYRPPTNQGSTYSTPRPAMPSYGTGSNYNSTGVNGYMRSNGTYVAPAMRSMPDSSLNNNWSTKGNRNPYTGASGTKRGNYGW